MMGAGMVGSFGEDSQTKSDCSSQRDSFHNTEALILLTKLRLLCSINAFFSQLNR
jgi:hypothetical protein